MNTLHEKSKAKPSVSKTLHKITPPGIPTRLPLTTHNLYANHEPS